MIYQKTVSWTFLKSIVISKKLFIQYIEFNTSYQVLAVDGDLTIECVIDKAIPNADLTDFETNFLPTANLRLQNYVDDIVNTAGLENQLTVGLTAVEIKAGASRLTNRKLVTLYNSSNSTLYWGYTSGVTISTGTPIEKNQYVEWTVGGNLPVYVIAASGGNIARITEAS